MEFGVVRHPNSTNATLPSSTSRFKSRATCPLHSCPGAVHSTTSQDGPYLDAACTIVRSRAAPFRCS
jgi:hypothetical protein